MGNGCCCCSGAGGVGSHLKGCAAVWMGRRGSWVVWGILRKPCQGSCHGYKEQPLLRRINSASNACMMHRGLQNTHGHADVPEHVCMVKTTRCACRMLRLTHLRR